jgi:hypothetical protein
MGVVYNGQAESLTALKSPAKEHEDAIDHILKGAPAST